MKRLPPFTQVVPKGPSVIRSHQEIQHTWVDQRSVVGRSVCSRPDGPDILVNCRDNHPP
jgi:hypothetical protein